MKKTIIAIVSAFILAAGAAESISGVDSLAIGNLAGKGGSANRTVVIGSGAGAYMTGGDSNLFVGAASGLRTKNVKSSVALGHYAMRGATNLTRCVGIGDLAFKGATNLTDATWINGHFVAIGEQFWIGATGNDAPIRYDGEQILLASRPMIFLSYDENGNVAAYQGTNKIGIVAIEQNGNYRAKWSWTEIDPMQDGEPVIASGITTLRFINPQWDGNTLTVRIMNADGLSSHNSQITWTFGEDYIDLTAFCGYNCHATIDRAGDMPTAWNFSGRLYCSLDNIRVFAY